MQYLEKLVITDKITSIKHDQMCAVIFSCEIKGAFDLGNNTTVSFD